MVQRLKTVEYVFDQRTTSLALATRHDFAVETLYIPEATSRTFHDVKVEITVRDNVTSGTSLTSWLIGIKLGAVAFNDVTVTDTITHSGEQQSFIFTRDVTSYFQTNFGGGASQTCQVGVQFGAVATINITAKLYITYEYDDNGQDTRVKTVRIPLESNTGAITATLANVGTSQIPALDTFLPESSKVYRSRWIEMEGNYGLTGTTDAQTGLRFDADAESLDGLHENGLASDLWFRRIWRNNASTTNATHNLQARATSTTGFTMNHMTYIYCVTYEYSHTSSSTIMNSVILAPSLQNQTMGNAVAGDRTTETAEIWIEEPTTITLVQSAVKLFWDAKANLSGLNVYIGGQTARAYTMATSGVVCGCFALQQRFDSGSAQGSGLTIARGKNTIVVNAYTSDTTDFGTNMSGLIYLNYTSGKATDGDGSHNHTIMNGILDHGADALRTVSTSQGSPIPETNYFINSVIYETSYMQTLPANSAGFGMTIQCQVQSGEKQSAGWELINSVSPSEQDAEIGVHRNFVNARTLFDRYPNEPEDRLNIKTARIHRVYCPYTAQVWFNLGRMTTYHSITFTKSGTITGSSGGTVNIAFWRTSNRERADTTSRSGNGAFSITWYDDTEPLFAEAHESATRMGRSDTGTS